jgi:hypothetical protein
MNVHLIRIMHIFHVETAEYVNSLLTLSLSIVSLDLTKKSFMLLPKEKLKNWEWNI